MEPEELVAVCYAAWVLLGELSGLGFDGVSVFLELGDRLLGVMDFQDAVNFTDGCLFV